MTDLYYERGTCRLCHSSDLENVVPLEPMPIATPNFRLPDASQDHDVYRKAVPLNLHLCRSCGHLQILCVGNPEVQYRNYVYTTSLSLGLQKHFEQACEAICEKLAPAAESLVVELGSNDGTLLSFFKKKGLRVLGVDPAPKIAEAATKAGIETLPDFFGKATAEKIVAAKGSAAVVIANNMIANIDDLDDLVSGVRDVLADDGVFVFETQYGVDVIRDALLDTVYHEHLSYFNVRPLQSYLARFDLEMIDVDLIETKGGSIRVYAQPVGGGRPVSPRVATLIESEEREGFYSPTIYRAFSERLAGLRREILDQVDAQREKGRSVAGYGVSVGTTTLLPQFGLTDRIDFLVDDDPDKERSLIGPGYDIPVVGPDQVYEKQPGAIVVFAWRYAEPIMAKHERFLAEGGKFIVPLPRMSVY